MGEADDERGHEDAALEGLLEKERPKGLRRFALRVAGCVHQIAFPPQDVEVVTDALPLRFALDAGPQPGALAVEDLDDALLLVDLHCLDPGGEGMGLGAVGRGEQEHALRIVPQAAALHDVAASDQRREREAVGQRLPEGRRSGVTP